MISYRQLWAADPTAWRTAGTAWRSVVQLIERRATEIADSAGALRPDWSGVASRAAQTRLTALTDELRASAPALIEVDQILDVLASRLVQARALLEEAVRVATAGGVLIDRHGRARVDPAFTVADGRQGRVAAGVNAAIRTALELATAADRQAAHRLADLAADARAGWPATPGAPPPVGADPTAVRRWWAGLSRAQQRWLIRHDPVLIGRLDGVPVAARDQANRLLLERHRAVLLRQRSELLAKVGELPSLAGGLRDIDAALAGLAVVTDRLAEPTGARAYLLGLDPADDGRVILALGDPDQAEHVLTYVPGMTSDLASVAGELSRAERLAARCAELAPAERTATILWLDYDAPDFLDEAMSRSRAEAAAPTLHRFQEGLRASHDGPSAQQTVLGHSYGSLVVGVTAREHGLAADNVIFLGSPGVGVDHASELNLPEGTVWAGTAGNDIIRRAVAPTEILGRLALGAALPGVGTVRALTEPVEHLWFGRDPSSPDFGARSVPSAPDGHLGYWNADNPALEASARIAVSSSSTPP